MINKDDVESIRDMIADTTLKVRQLTRLSLGMAKALNSKEEMSFVTEAGKSIQNDLALLASWLERQEDFYKLLDGRGLGKAKRETLEARYKQIGELLEVLN